MPLFAQVIHDCKQFLYLRLGQSRRRFVKNQQFGIPRNCFGDLHHLLLTDRKRTETHRRIYTNTYALKQRLCILNHLAIVNKYTALFRLASDVYVLRHGQVSHHV